MLATDVLELFVGGTLVDWGMDVVGTVAGPVTAVVSPVVPPDGIEDAAADEMDVDVDGAVLAGADDTVDAILAEGGELRFGAELLQLAATTAIAATTMPYRRTRDADSELTERSLRRAVRGGILTNRMIGD